MPAQGSQHAKHGIQHATGCTGIDLVQVVGSVEQMCEPAIIIIKPNPPAHVKVTAFWDPKSLKQAPKF